MVKDIGIDLGTANVVIYVTGQGIVLNEPAVVAVNTFTGGIVAMGTEAYRMIGRTPAFIEVIRPLKGGVIADFNLAEAMLTHFIDRLNIKSFFSKPDILICCPADITAVEQKVILEAAEKCGGKNVYLEEEPKAAAIGAGLDVFEPNGNMVIDIGGGTSDIAVLSLGSIVASSSIKTAGEKLDADIIKYVKRQHRLLIGERTAEKVKMTLGTAVRPEREEVMEIRGRDLITGLPRTAQISSPEVFEAMQETLQAIVKRAKEVLETTPPEVAADLVNTGAVVTGGGARIKDIEKLFSSELELPVFSAEQALDAVALGTGVLLEKLYRHQSPKRSFGGLLEIFIDQNQKNIGKRKISHEV